MADLKVPPTDGVVGLVAGRESLSDLIEGGAGRSPRVGGKVEESSVGGGDCLSLKLPTE
jgi:hypothetical protein